MLQQIAEALKSKGLQAKHDLISVTQGSSLAQDAKHKDKAKSMSIPTKLIQIENLDDKCSAENHTNSASSLRLHMRQLTSVEDRKKSISLRNNNLVLNYNAKDKKQRRMTVHQNNVLGDMERHMNLLGCMKDKSCTKYTAMQRLFQDQFKKQIAARKYEKTFEQQYLRFKRMEQGDKIEKIALELAGKGTRRHMEIQGSGSYYDRLFMSVGIPRMQTFINDEKMGISKEERKYRSTSQTNQKKNLKKPLNKPIIDLSNQNKAKLSRDNKSSLNIPDQINSNPKVDILISQDTYTIPEFKSNKYTSATNLQESSANNIIDKTKRLELPINVKQKSHDTQKFVVIQDEDPEVIETPESDSSSMNESKSSSLKTSFFTSAARVASSKNVNDSVNKPSDNLNSAAILEEQDDYIQAKNSTSDQGASQRSESQTRNPQQYDIQCHGASTSEVPEPKLQQLLKKKSNDISSSLNIIEEQVEKQEYFSIKNKSGGQPPMGNEEEVSNRQSDELDEKQRQSVDQIKEQSVQQSKKSSQSVILSSKFKKSARDFNKLAQDDILQQVSNETVQVSPKIKTDIKGPDTSHYPRVISQLEKQIQLLKEQKQKMEALYRDQQSEKVIEEKVGEQAKSDQMTSEDNISNVQNIVKQEDDHPERVIEQPASNREEDRIQSEMNENKFENEPTENKQKVEQNLISSMEDQLEQNKTENDTSNKPQVDIQLDYIEPEPQINNLNDENEHYQKKQSPPQNSVPQEAFTGNQTDILIAFQEKQEEIKIRNQIQPLMREAALSSQTTTETNQRNRAQNQVSQLAQNQLIDNQQIIEIDHQNNPQLMITTSPQKSSLQNSKSHSAIDHQRDLQVRVEKGLVNIRKIRRNLKSGKNNHKFQQRYINPRDCSSNRQPMTNISPESNSFYISEAAIQNNTVFQGAKPHQPSNISQSSGTQNNLNVSSRNNQQQQLLVQSGVPNLSAQENTTANMHLMMREAVRRVKNRHTPAVQPAAHDRYRIKAADHQQPPQIYLAKSSIYNGALKGTSGIPKLHPPYLPENLSSLTQHPNTTANGNRQQSRGTPSGLSMSNNWGLSQQFANHQRKQSNMNGGAKSSGLQNHQFLKAEYLQNQLQHLQMLKHSNHGQPHEALPCNPASHSAWNAVLNQFSLESSKRSAHEPRHLRLQNHRLHSPQSNSHLTKSLRSSLKLDPRKKSSIFEIQRTTGFRGDSHGGPGNSRNQRLIQTAIKERRRKSSQKKRRQIAMSKSRNFATTQMQGLTHEVHSNENPMLGTFEYELASTDQNIFNQHRDSSKQMGLNDTNTNENQNIRIQNENMVQYSPKKPRYSRTRKTKVQKQSMQSQTLNTLIDNAIQQQPQQQQCNFTQANTTLELHDTQNNGILSKIQGTQLLQLQGVGDDGRETCLNLTAGNDFNRDTVQNSTGVSTGAGGGLLQSNPFSTRLSIDYDSTQADPVSSRMLLEASIQIVKQRQNMQLKSFLNHNKTDSNFSEKKTRLCGKSQVSTYLQSSPEIQGSIYGPKKNTQGHFRAASGNFSMKSPQKKLRYAITRNFSIKKSMNFNQAVSARQQIATEKQKNRKSFNDKNFDITAYSSSQHQRAVNSQYLGLNL